MSIIHVLRHDEPAGPFSEEEIQAQLARGELTPADYAWREGMADWQPLAEVIALPGAPPSRPDGHPARKKRRVPPAFAMAGLTEFLEVFPDRLLITPKGGQALHTQVSPGIREVPVDQLLDIGYKLPGFTHGYLQFTVSGPAGASKAPTDANTFRFAKSTENIEAAGRITAFIQARMHEARAAAQQGRAVPAAETAGANLSDELGRLAVLRDQGVLTEAEFQAAKQRLLA